MTRKAGTVSSETRAAILSSALNEFSTYGFQGSSLRRIASDAGVTTGAIYCFYRSKDELFQSVTDTVTLPMLKYIKSKYDAEIAALRINPEIDRGHDYEIADYIINCYFRHKTTWDVIVKHQHHPAVVAFSEDFIEMSVKHYMLVLSMSRKFSDEKLETLHFAITQFAHMQTESMSNIVSQDFRKPEMLEHSRTTVRMLRGAFYALLDD